MKILPWYQQFLGSNGLIQAPKHSCEAGGTILTNSSDLEMAGTLFPLLVIDAVVPLLDSKDIVLLDINSPNITESYPSRGWMLDGVC